MTEQKKIDIEEIRKKKRARAKREKAKQLSLAKRNLQDTTNLTKARVALTPILFSFVLLISILFSLRDGGGFFLPWFISFFKSFVQFKWSFFALVAIILSILFLVYPYRKMIDKKSTSKLEKYTAQARVLTIIGFISLLGLGLFVPAVAWNEARGILPIEKFNVCISSLSNNNNAIVALNKGNGKTQYATVADSRNGVSINKYALEPNDNNGWEVTNMNTGEKMENLPGC